MIELEYIVSTKCDVYIYMHAVTHYTTILYSYMQCQYKVV